jgi:hypothetical protein
VLFLISMNNLMPAYISTGLEAGASIYLAKPAGYLGLKKALERVPGA